MLSWFFYKYKIQNKICYKIYVFYDHETDELMQHKYVFANYRCDIYGVIKLHLAYYIVNASLNGKLNTLTSCWYILCGCFN